MESTLSSGMRSPQASSMPTSAATASTTRWLSPEIMMVRRCPSHGACRSPPSPLRGRVHQAQHAELAVPVQHDHGGPAVAFECSTVARIAQAAAARLLGEQVILADVGRLAVNLGPHAAAGDAFNPVASTATFTVQMFGGVADHGLRQGVVAQRFYRGGNAEQFVFFDPSAGSTSVSRGSPLVIVPVLSKAIAVSWPRFSRGHRL